MTSADYNFSQSVLYVMAKTVLQNLNTDLQDFSAFKSKYDSVFIQTLQNGLVSAVSIKNDQARNAVFQTARNELTEKAKTLRSQFQKLKSYVEEAYIMDNLVQIEMDAAGQNYYARAANNDWDALESLSNAFDLYLVNNQTKLMQNGFMTSTFMQDTQTVISQTKDAIIGYVTARQDSKLGTDAKINANNGLYKKIAAICRDGQRIFAENDSFLQKYTISSLQQLIGGTGTSGIRGLVADINGNGIANASIKIVETGQLIQTDNSGKYGLKSLKADEYTLEISAQNFQTVSETIIVMPGTMSGFNYTLAAI